MDEDAGQVQGPGSAPSLDKPAWRTMLLQRRRERTSAELATARAAIRRIALDECARQGWTTVAAYVPMRTEPGSTELLDELTARNVRVLVPVRLPDNDLDWTVWGAATPLGPGAVAAADAVLVPALAVAADGTRLGRGGGSYDRALARVRPDAAVAALLFDGERVPVLPRERWDLPVRAVLTPSGWESITPPPG